MNYNSIEQYFKILLHFLLKHNKIFIGMIVLFILCILPGYFSMRYYTILPSPFYLYNDSVEEAKIVKKHTKDRDDDDIEFFKLTDPSIAHAFLPHVNEDLKYLENTILLTNPTIWFYKLLFNRPRPYQIDSTIDVLESKTADTPAYPAGHALQAYYLSHILSKKYPKKKDLFDKLANKCDMVRVKAGLHYPSDGKLSKNIANYINNIVDIFY